MEKITNCLNEFLSDLNVYFRKLQNYHWNIQGKDFFVMHEKLEEYYDEIAVQIDEVAEHILMLGEQPLGTMQDYLNISKIQEAKNEKVDSQEVFRQLIDGYTGLLAKAKEIKQEAETQNCYATSSLMDGYILDYKKKLWMLNQSCAV